MKFRMIWLGPEDDLIGSLPAPEGTAGGARGSRSSAIRTARDRDGSPGTNRARGISKITPHR